MSEIIEASNLPEGEKIYLKRSFDGWRTVQPIKNEDNSWNYPNLLFGGWGNLLRLFFYIILIIILYYGMQNLIENYRIIAANPCKFCYISINSSILNLNLSIP